MGKCQRIVEQDAFPCLIEHKGPLHQGAIHLEEASKECARTRRYLQNPLGEDEHGVLTIHVKMFDASLLVLHNDNALGRVLSDNREL
jgi:hypothetical protein